MRLSGSFLAGSLVAAAIVSASGCKGGGDSGAVLYEKACARCHGLDGKGGMASSETAGVASRDLADPAWQKTVTDDELRTVVRDGRRKMPAFGHLLSIDKIDLVVKHLRTLIGGAAATANSAPMPASAPASASSYAAPAAAPQ